MRSDYYFARMVIMSNREAITSSDLPINLKLFASKEVLNNESLKAGIEDIEKSSIITALEQPGWVQAKVARILGITSWQIGYKIKKYGIGVLTTFKRLHNLCMHSLFD